MSDWLLTMHWTAGSYVASDFDRQFYHDLIDGQGRHVPGKFQPEANIPILRNGQYAAHCGGGNSYNIGLAICGMAGFQSTDNPGRFPLTRKSFEAACKRAAVRCDQYKIPIVSDRVFTHYEFGRRHPGTSSAGKIDIIYLPFEPSLHRDEVGDFMRNKVRWYLSKLRG